MCKGQRLKDEYLKDKISEAIEKRLLQAKESYQRMEKEIQPFLKRRQIRQYSTAGQWYDSTSLFMESD
jgi:hypothetical protein